MGPGGEPRGERERAGGRLVGRPAVGRPGHEGGHQVRRSELLTHIYIYFFFFYDNFTYMSNMFFQLLA